MHDLLTTASTPAVGSGALLGFLLALLLVELREQLLDVLWFSGRAELPRGEPAWLSNLPFRYHRHRLLLLWWCWACRRLAAALRSSAARQSLLGFELPGESLFLLLCHKILIATKPNVQGERREAAAADVRLASELNGCLPFAPPCGLA